MEHPEGEVICVEDTRNEAELAFQVCRLLDGSEEYSQVSEYHVVPVQGEDGSIVGVQVTGIQRDEEGGSSQLPTRMFEVRRLEEPLQHEASPRPPPGPPASPAQKPPVPEPESPSPTVPSAATPEPPPPQPAASPEGKTDLSGLKTLYRCGQCMFSSFILSALRRHMRRHSNKHKCEICSKTFACTRELQLHLNGHMGIRPYKCKECDMSYRTATDLLRHTRSVHTLEKPFQCCYCDYTSVEASRMKVHIRSHTGERPFACNQCPFAATDAFKLRRHLRTHTGEKPYGCQLCQARFTQNASLKMHILRKHTANVQKECCPVCNAILFGKNDVKNHIRKQHTYLETPMKCRICSEEFHERYLFRQHQDVHRAMKTAEPIASDPGAGVLQEKLQVEEVNGQEVEISTSEGVVSWSAVPPEAEEQLCVNIEEDKQLSTVTELHGIPVQGEDGSIVQAIVVQGAQPLEAQSVHAEVYSVQHLQEVLQPLVEQHSAIIALDPVAEQTMQSAEQQDVTAECYPLATSTPQRPSWKGRRIQPISPEQQIEVKLHRCRECEETFATGMELVKHRKSHRLENVFKCPFCEHETTGALELILHIQVHNDDRPFHCEQCSFTTTDTFKLSRHMRTHTGEKPFSCHVCQARFTQKTSMEMHIQRKHTKELPKLSCPVCSTTLTGKHSLNIHMRKQHSHLEEELQCRFCPETFRERFMLREHQKSHRNEKVVKSNAAPALLKKGNVTEQQQQEVEQGNVVEPEPVAAAQAEEYTFQVLPSEQEIHFVISEAEDAGTVTEYHVLPVQADDGSIISIQVAGLEEVGRIGANAIHQVILGDF